MPRQVLRVESRESLAELDRDTKPGFKRRHRGIEVALPSLTDEENAALTSRLNRLYRACGCAEGMVGGLIGLGAFGAWLAVRDGSWSWWDIPRGAGSMFAGITIGKLLGLWRAHLSLRHVVRDLVARHGAREPEAMGPERCAHS